jgi:hypothetical protein
MTSFFKNIGIFLRIFCHLSLFDRFFGGNIYLFWPTLFELFPWAENNFVQIVQRAIFGLGCSGRCCFFLDGLVAFSGKGASPYFGLF